jgi:hypothetical protein
MIEATPRFPGSGKPASGTEKEHFFFALSLRPGGSRNAFLAAPGPRVPQHPKPDIHILP